MAAWPDDLLRVVTALARNSAHKVMKHVLREESLAADIVGFEGKRLAAPAEPAPIDGVEWRA